MSSPSQASRARKVALNLTPLLDLLLILIFASQLNTWIVAAETQDRATTEISQLREDNSSKQIEISRIGAELSESRSETKDFEAKVASLMNEISKSEADLTTNETRTALAVSLLLQIAKAHQDVLSKEEIRAISEISDKFSFSDSSSLEVFTRFNEMQKLTSFWEVKYLNDYRLTISDENSSQEVFLEDNLTDDTSKLDMAFQRLAEPRKVVFLFFSYSDVLIHRRDTIKKLLCNMVRSNLPESFKNSIFYLIEEGYGKK